MTGYDIVYDRTSKLRSPGLDWTWLGWTEPVIDHNGPGLDYDNFKEFLDDFIYKSILSAAVEGIQGGNQKRIAYCMSMSEPTTRL